MAMSVHVTWQWVHVTKGGARACYRAVCACVTRQHTHLFLGKPAIPRHVEVRVHQQQLDCLAGETLISNLTAQGHIDHVDGRLD